MNRIIKAIAMLSVLAITGCINDNKKVTAYSSHLAVPEKKKDINPDKVVPLIVTNW